MSSGPDGSATNTPTKATPKKATSTPKTPRSRVVKSTPKKRKASSEESGDGSEGGNSSDEDIMSPSAAAGKRGKRASYTEPESEDDGLGGPVEKPVKAEPVDDDDYSIFGDYTYGDEQEKHT
ncbi:hypothetical protein N0V83_007458 [Neocucurbitaria cava]|uniref:Uncharacterized protein n=1 Tax=Neocucurbitaria cava TaxID=798079 RepID=A0A9W8Y4C1_9PLEO|nr:hypothetical protein N0V83_007458 [Neocucurbitaria cava]